MNTRITIKRCIRIAKSDEYFGGHIMKVLVTGVNGQLGFDVIVELKKRGYETVGVDAQDMDITDFELVSKVMNEVKPQAVIHCAAYTAVDKAEENIGICRKVDNPVVDFTHNYLNNRISYHCFILPVFLIGVCFSTCFGKYKRQFWNYFRHLCTIDRFPDFTS